MRGIVIGGGFSGSAVCLQLLQAGQHTHITLIERHPAQLNRGVAYSAVTSQQLLNVPAARMGLYAQDPTDFHRWSARDGRSVGAGDFLQRRSFGDYVEQAFQAAVRAHPDRVSVVIGEAVGIVREADGYRVRLVDGNTHQAEQVLLALGSAPPAHVPKLGPSAQVHPGYIPWPWVPGALDPIAPEAAVMFVGSGLTMVDLVLSLADQGHRGPVIVLSRRGFLPRPHAAHGPYVFATAPPDVATTPVVDLLAWMREEVRHAAAQDLGWQAVIDAVRPQVQQWWRLMPRREREAFLRHLRPFWEVHRHRMPAALHQRLLTMQAEGRLRIVAGRIQAVDGTDTGLSVRYQERGRCEEVHHAVDHLINCTGPQSDSRRIDHPLLVDLLQQGLVSWDPLHMGLQCTPEGAVIDREGRVSDDLYLIGPMCKAALWECTAVPEIREQVRVVAERLSASAG